MEKQSPHSKDTIGRIALIGLVVFWVVLSAAATYMVFQDQAVKKFVAKHYAEAKHYSTGIVHDVQEELGLSDGADIPLGVAISDDAREGMKQAWAYQAGAFVVDEGSFGNYPAIRISLPNTTPPNLPAGDTGSIWLGVTLNNGTFLQLGMITDNVTNASKTQWNVFWQNWSNNVYTSGYQIPITDIEGVQLENTFVITCRDPEVGEWELWMNDTVVGKTTSGGNCDAKVSAVHVFWELTTNSQKAKADLPEFGPFKLSAPEYWDDYDWKVTQKGIASYSFGEVFSGTQIDVATVCPPYGLQPIADSNSFMAGSSITCAPLYSDLW